MNKEMIRKAYVKNYLEDGHPAVSVYAFCKKLKMEEDAFYKLYNSLEAVEKDVWVGWFDDTLAILSLDQTYTSYSAREKLLAFYFTWIQKLRQNRSYILLQKEKLDMKSFTNSPLSAFKKSFEEYAHDLIQEGISSNEVVERKFISDKYQHGFWLQLLFVLGYWVKDDSLEFENTDAAIEKAVNLSFKLIGEGAIDSIIDFGKFLLQRK